MGGYEQAKIEAYDAYVDAVVSLFKKSFYLCGVSASMAFLTCVSEFVFVDREIRQTGKAVGLSVGLVVACVPMLICTYVLVLRQGAQKWSILMSISCFLLTGFHITVIYLFYAGFVPLPLVFRVIATPLPIVLIPAIYAILSHRMHLDEAMSIGLDLGTRKSLEKVTYPALNDALVKLGIKYPYIPPDPPERPPTAADTTSRQINRG